MKILWELSTNMRTLRYTYTDGRREIKKPVAVFEILRTRLLASGGGQAKKIFLNLGLGRNWILELCAAKFIRISKKRNYWSSRKHWSNNILGNLHPITSKLLVFFKNEYIQVVLYKCVLCFLILNWRAYTFYLLRTVFWV
jgi:hypothetical protein